MIKSIGHHTASQTPTFLYSSPERHQQSKTSKPCGTCDLRWTLDPLFPDWSNPSFLWSTREREMISWIFSQFIPWRHYIYTATITSQFAEIILIFIRKSNHSFKTKVTKSFPVSRIFHNPIQFLQFVLLSIWIVFRIISIKIFTMWNMQFNSSIHLCLVAEKIHKYLKFLTFPLPTTHLISQIATQIFNLYTTAEHRYEQFSNFSFSR